MASLLPTRFKPKSWNRRFKHWTSKGILKVGQLVTRETFLTYLETETNAASLLVKPSGLCAGSDHHRSHAVPGGRAGAGGTKGTPAAAWTPGAAWGGNLGAEYIIFSVYRVARELRSSGEGAAAAPFGSATEERRSQCCFQGSS